MTHRGFTMASSLPAPVPETSQGLLYFSHRVPCPLQTACAGSLRSGLLTSLPHVSTRLQFLNARQVAAEESWQRLLLTIRQALGSGRRMLWDDAARRLAVLLTAPAAFAAEHFTQVQEHTGHGCFVMSDFTPARTRNTTACVTA